MVGNCESPVVERVRRPLGTAAGARHAMTAAFLSDTLDAAGIARKRLVLSLANNHMLDQGIDGFAETRAALAGNGHRNHRRSAKTGLVADHRSRRARRSRFAAFTRVAQCQPRRTLPAA